MMKPKVLFLCTANSCRSQMAEGLLRHMARDRFEVMSAGTTPTELNPDAVRVMQEIDIDISRQRAKDSAQYFGQRFHYVITVCRKAKETCPIFPGAIWRLDWDIPDPAAAEGTEAERLAVFRRVRDEIEDHVRELIAKES
jgi:arsenate reductase